MLVEKPQQGWRTEFDQSKDEAVIRVHRQQVAPLRNDGELVNQSLEFRDQMGGNENRAAVRITRLISADDRLDEFAPHNGVQPGSRFIQHLMVVVLPAPLRPKKP
jgi:hypothetical protein